MAAVAVAAVTVLVAAAVARAHDAGGHVAGGRRGGGGSRGSRGDGEGGCDHGGPGGSSVRHRCPPRAGVRASGRWIDLTTWIDRAVLPTALGLPVASPQDHDRGGIYLWFPRTWSRCEAVWCAASSAAMMRL